MIKKIIISFISLIVGVTMIAGIAWLDVWVKQNHRGEPIHAAVSVWCIFMFMVIFAAMCTPIIWVLIKQAKENEG